MKHILKKLIENNKFSSDDAKEAMYLIMSGDATHSQVAAFITGLRFYGETPEIISACAEVMREYATPVICNDENAVDIVGTGGDQSNTFNISTTAAFVVAGAGITVAKHGSYGVSSLCGSANVLNELGINLEYSPQKMEKCLKEINIAFLFAPSLHPAMRHVVPSRKEIGVWSIFNILGPLCNPSFTKRGITGVFKTDLLSIVANSCRDLECNHQIIVHGKDGLDEITTTDETLMFEVKNGIIREFTFNPSELNIPLSYSDDIKGGSPSQNAVHTRNILAGKEKGSRKDIVLINAAFAIYTSGKTSSIQDSLAMAKQAIDSGEALKKLDKLIKLSND